jgi:hypothetical protein
MKVLMASVALWLLASPAQALDGPFTWEEVICDADAAAEVEMILATDTTRDRMEVRRVTWNQTKHRIRPNYGHPNIPDVTKTRDDLLQYMPWYRRSGPRRGPVPEWVDRHQRALARGSYRTIIFVKHDRALPWDGGGVAYVKGEQWLDHPNHADWWARVQPLLEQRIEAAKQGKWPKFCQAFEPDRARAHLPPRRF